MCGNVIGQYPLVCLQARHLEPFVEVHSLLLWENSLNPLQIYPFSVVVKVVSSGEVKVVSSGEAEDDF